ncbi:hypothetical protein ACFLUT_00155 [Chloroflexota bacterium]
MATSKRKPKADTDMELRVASLEDRVAKLEADVSGKRKKRTRTYTDEERAAIRARLIAGQQAAAERRKAAEGTSQNRA